MQYNLPITHRYQETTNCDGSCYNMKWSVDSTGSPEKRRGNLATLSRPITTITRKCLWLHATTSHSSCTTTLFAHVMYNTLPVSRRKYPKVLAMTAHYLDRRVTWSAPDPDAPASCTAGSGNLTTEHPLS